MLPANIILVLAWTLSGICRDLLMSAQYVEGLVTSFGGDVMQLFPFICFAAACVLSFATGASWATFGILVPIFGADCLCRRSFNGLCCAGCRAGRFSLRRPLLSHL
ncbi:Na+/H+ antiporter NhaC family protein [Sutterella wadsworthensis]|uniref:Na+/H+ antiporter NhaC family protein n=1 Tax=Sutterella wadsworthensis TaxID=40545 RepID=UPI00351FA818